MTKSETSLFEIQKKGTILPALGFIEVSSIAMGLVLTDVAIKKAPVHIVTSQPVSSGKHVLLFFGDVASVEESLTAVKEKSGSSYLRDILIPYVHEDLVPYLTALWGGKNRGKILDSIALIESTTLAGAILSLDKALKTAEVSLVRLELGQGIGGKAFYLITGNQESVEAASESATEVLNELDSFCAVETIARPDPMSLDYLLGV
tara:strand:- start:7159 stop:7773 length:615 start_codon:yes stop_codon:yes gene_type:complete